MKTFYIGYNNYWKTAHISFDTVPTGLYYLEMFVMWLCSKIPSIPLPNIKIKLKYSDDDIDFTENNDGRTTLKEWYGDTQQLFHLYICSPVFYFVNKHTKSIGIDFPYDFLKEQFPAEFGEDDFDYDEDEMEFKKKVDTMATWLDVGYRDVYKRLNYEYMRDSVK